jgi:hypothetical protein
MNIIRGVISGLLAAAIAFTAPDLLAQFSGGKSGSSGRTRGGAPSSGIQAPRPSSDGNIVELVEFRLNLLEEDLRLTANQQKLWAPYAERVRALAADIARERAPSQSIAPPTAMQQVNRAVDIARNRLTALEDVGAAAKTLYDGLSPEQKMLADSRFVTIIPLIAGNAPQGSAPEATGRSRPPPDSGFGPPRGGERDSR